ncbi:hypothetical protein GALL_420750 [mine drainage metagenome]|uniref:EF-hand domain-containing protein n=1 Tax=mine drainage metagenome TaxID=410659 RepID=A0A1J5QFF4_9ZZZZ
MLARLHRGYAALLTSGSQLLLLLIGVYFRTPTAWRVSLSLIAILSLIAWLAVLRRLRAFTDTPTSLVASAAQGYVELQGRGRPLDGLPVLSPVNSLPCLWYRFKIERRSGDKWVMDSSGESDASFLLEDATGTCAVDPEGAEIMPLRFDKWLEGDRRYSQWLILEHELLHVLGAFRTESAGDFDLSVDEEVGQLLADWKQDRPTLLQRFDLDRDGDLDLREWQLVRAQARREVERRRAEESRNRNDLHLMAKPDDGRLYLISTLSAAKLARRYSLWAWAHVAIFFVALIGLAKIGSLISSG